MKRKTIKIEIGDSYLERKYSCGFFVLVNKLKNGLFELILISAGERMNIFAIFYENKCWHA